MLTASGQYLGNGSKAEGDPGVGHPFGNREPDLGEKCGEIGATESERIRFAMEAANRAVTRRFGLERTETDDLVQDAMVCTLKRHPDLGEVRDLGGYLYTVACNLFRNQLAQRTRRDPPHTGEAGDNILSQCECRDRSPAEAAALRDDGDKLHRTIERLPEIFREAIGLRFLNGFPLQQIADTTGIKPNTVKWRVYNGLEKLETEWYAAAFKGLPPLDKKLP